MEGEEGDVINSKIVYLTPLYSNTQSCPQLGLNVSQFPKPIIMGCKLAWIENIMAYHILCVG
jgi:hypothetical protein